MTREEWLQKAAAKLRNGIFRELNETVPDIHVSTGFPHGQRTAIGQAWHFKASADKKPQVFISPIISDSIRVLDILTHELIHTMYPEEGHRGNFRRVKEAIGLEGDCKSTTCSLALRVKLQRIVAVQGDYPHPALTPADFARKKQGTRMLKMECTACGYIARTTQSWLDRYGTTLCPCNSEPMKGE